MANYIGAVGVSLPPPGALYPATINALPTVVGTNALSLPAGGIVVLPPGRFQIIPGQYSCIQTKDPVSGAWLPVTTSDSNTPNYFDSDGTNYRVFNPLGTCIGAIVNNAGNSYTAAPTVTAASGGSTWQAIIGGGVSKIVCATGGSGSNYTYPPLVNLSVPPNPGVQATAVCAVSGGLVTGFTLINPGAGYGTAAPTITMVPHPLDPNLGLITNATAVATVSYVGQVTAILNVLPGLPQTAIPALTVAGGGGSGGTATAFCAFMVGGYGITTAGSGYPATGVSILSFGGLITSAAAFPSTQLLSNSIFLPRNVNIIGAVSGSGVSLNGNLGGGVTDGGFFQQAPTLVAIPGPSIGGVAAVLTATLSFANDTVYISPL